MPLFDITLGMFTAITLFFLICAFSERPKRRTLSPPVPSTQEHVLAALHAARELDEGDLEALAATLYAPAKVVHPKQGRTCQICSSPATARVAQTKTWKTWVLCDLHSQSCQGEEYVREYLP